MVASGNIYRCRDFCPAVGSAGTPREGVGGTALNRAAAHSAAAYVGVLPA